MQLETTVRFGSYGNYTLEKLELLPENKNKVHHVSLLASELIEQIAELPFCEIRELPDWKFPIHAIVDPDAQKLIQMFHRYGTDPNSESQEKLCPFNGGLLKDKFTSLVGPDNLISNFEEASKPQRKTLLSFFTKNKLDELEMVWKRITQKWLTNQMQQPKVLLFNSSLQLVCQCLIEGIMGYNDCSLADIDLNVKFWKKLLKPTTSEQRSVKEYEMEGEPGFLQNGWNMLQDSPELAQKLYTYNFKSTEIDQLTLKIYKATVFLNGTLSHYLNEAQYSEKMILENLKGMLLAGQETVGHLLGFMLYEYAKNPFMQDEHARDTSKIKNAYLESLRLYSVAGAQREAAFDMVLSHEPKNQNKIEHYIRKGDLIACIPLVSGHSTHYWDDAEAFNANRKNLEQVKKNPHFGSGAHRCIGEKAAELEIKTIMEVILSNATMEATVPLPELPNAFTLRPKVDIAISFKSNF